MTGTCPVATDLLMRVNVRTTTPTAEVLVGNMLSRQHPQPNTGNMRQEIAPAVRRQSMRSLRILYKKG